MGRTRLTSSRQIGVGGRILGTLVFLFFFCMGLLFCVFIGREVYLGAKTYRWNTVNCVILESRVDQHANGSTPYVFRVRYEYEWQGRSYSATNWSRKDRAFSDYGSAQQLATRYPLDSRAICFASPATPSEALLERPSLWFGLSILLPLMFVAIGGTGIVAMWSKGGESNEAPAKESTQPISSQAGKRAGTKFAVGFFALFFVIGAVVFYFITARPLLNVLAARGWVATPCTIISSRVQSHRSDDGNTYRVDILYRYEVNGQEHRSSRYHFMGGSSSGRKSKAEIVRRHPPGAQRTCYVNPHNPDDAVLERGLTADMWFGAIPAVFMLVGAGGVYAMVRGKRNGGRSRHGAAADPEPVPAREIIGAVSPGTAVSALMDDPSAPRVLKPASSRLVGLIAVGVFAVIWNGIIWSAGLPSGGVFRRGVTGAFDVIHILFVIPFYGVGLVLIGVVIYQWLALYNPKAEITITPGVPALGGKLDLAWRLTGRIHVLRNLKIVLEAREEATYRQGTRTSTDSKVFLKLDVTSASDVAAMSEGRVNVTLPENTMPTFTAKNNRIIWSLRVTGDIPRWPDLKEEFVIEVRPPPAPRPT